MTAGHCCLLHLYPTLAPRLSRYLVRTRKGLIAQAQVVIPSGTKVTALLEQALYSANSMEGQAVNLTVVANVRVGEAVVIP